MPQQKVRSGNRSWLLEPALAAGLLLMELILAMTSGDGFVGVAVGALACIAAGFSGRFLVPSIVGVALATVGYWMIAPITVGPAEYACLIPVASAMAQGRRRVALIAAALFVVQEAVAYVLREGIVILETLIATLIWGFLMGVVAAAGEVIHRTRLLEQMRQREIYRALQRELASDLHDTVAHQLGSIALWAEQAARNGGASVEEIQHNGRIASFAMRDLRRVVELLDIGSIDEPVVSVKTLAAIVALSKQRLIKAGFSVKVTIEGDLDSLPKRLAVPLEKTLTEIMNNIERHGELSTPVSIIVEMTSDAIELLVSNGFSGHRSAVEGRGLIGVRERIALIGGNVEILTKDRHWTVHLAVPMETEPA